MIAKAGILPNVVKKFDGDCSDDEFDFIPYIVSSSRFSFEHFFLEIKQSRIFHERSDVWKSCFGRTLQDVTLSDASSPASIAFRRRNRLPYSVYTDILRKVLSACYFVFICLII